VRFQLRNCVSDAQWFLLVHIADPNSESVSVAEVIDDQMAEMTHDDENLADA